MDLNNLITVNESVAGHTREPLVFIECSFAVFLSLFFLLSVFGCSPKKESTTSDSSTKFEQYYVQGQQLYIKNCSNCHQQDGTGLGLLYPPVSQSDFLQTNFEAVICLLRYGKKGELIVNGKSFNKEMPGIPTLTDLEISEIATYIYNSWNNERGIIDVTDVTKILATCESDQ